MTPQLALAPDDDVSAIHAWLVTVHGLTPAQASEQIYGTCVPPAPVPVDLSRYETREEAA